LLRASDRKGGYSKGKGGPGRSNALKACLTSSKGYGKEAPGGEIGKWGEVRDQQQEKGLGRIQGKRGCEESSREIGESERLYEVKGSSKPPGLS